MANSTLKTVTKVAAVVFGFALAPAFIAAEYTPNYYYPLSGALPPQLAGDPCAVRVYHTNFQFPSQGGKIVLVGDEMFFIKDYAPGCQNAGAGAPVLSASNSRYNPAQYTGNTSPMGSFYINPYFGRPFSQATYPAPGVTPAIANPTPSTTPTCY